MKQFKKILTFAFILGLLLQNKSVIYANTLNTNGEGIIKETNSNVVEILNDDGEVMAYFIPIEEESGIQPLYAANINYETGYGSFHGNSRFQLTTSSKVKVNISITPNVSSYIGLYDNNSHTYGFTSSSSTGWNGYIVPSYNGNFSIAIKNCTNTKALYSGTYEV